MKVGFRRVGFCGLDASCEHFRVYVVAQVCQVVQGGHAQLSTLSPRYQADQPDKS